MKSEKMDMAKVLAILAQPKQTPPPLEHVTRMRLEIPYITKDARVDTRAVRVVLPEDAVKPLPLVYIPHYEMGEDSLELRDYLAEGWAVACPDAFNDTYNAHLTDDDLVFNNAALHTLRQRPEFDCDKIVLVGGSAGAYMAGMLAGLQLGICATIANGMPANVYFNFYKYFTQTQARNLQALEQLSKDGALPQPEPGQGALGILSAVEKLPVPFLAALYGIFSPINKNLPPVNENLPDKEDVCRWTMLSPLGLADCFSSPLMENHCTSDVLVPVDQISRDYTYEAPGESLPADFDYRLHDTYPGLLKYTLAERLPAAQTVVRCIPVPEHAGEEDLPFDADKQFNINIFDDGPIEGYGTHSSRMDVGRRHDVPYLRKMMERTAKQTCWLTPEMLRSMIVRYQGKSVTLPAHIGVDDAVYGSLAVYREEIRQELHHWVENHGAEAFNSVAAQVLRETPEAERSEYQSTLTQMLA